MSKRSLALSCTKRNSATDLFRRVCSNLTTMTPLQRVCGFPAQSEWFSPSRQQEFHPSSPLHLLHNSLKPLPCFSHSAVQVTFIFCKWDIAFYFILPSYESETCRFSLSCYLFIILSHPPPPPQIITDRFDRRRPDRRELNIGVQRII